MYRSNICAAAIACTRAINIQAETEAKEFWTADWWNGMGKAMGFDKVGKWFNNDFVDFFEDTVPSGFENFGHGTVDLFKGDFDGTLEAWTGSSMELDPITPEARPDPMTYEEYVTSVETYRDETLPEMRK